MSIRSGNGGTAQSGGKDRSAYATLLLMTVVIGTFLRLWHWSHQVLLDDEWHALNFVPGKSLKDVLFTQGLGANSIPVNVYTWLLLHTTGWSEPLLRLPSMVAGIAALVVLPPLVARLWGRRAALSYGAFLAISPVLVFYSRNLRPYAPVMLLAPASLLLVLLWLKEGRRRDLVAAALCGSAAIYFHLYATIPVCVPLAVAFVCALLARRSGKTLPSGTPLTDLCLAGSLLTLIDGVLVVIPNVMNPWWAHGIQGVDHATVGTALRAWELVAGTHVRPLQVLLLVLAAAGLISVFRASKSIGTALAAPLSSFCLVMSLTTQEGTHAGIQVVRYGIAFVPLILALAAVGCVEVTRRLSFRVADRRQILVAGSCLVLVCGSYAAASPLWRTYRYPNNFTNHSAFQDHYTPTDWRRSPERDLAPGVSIDRSEVSGIYLDRRRLQGVPGIIEYPMLVGDYFNLYYYYQHFHRRPVRIGYLPDAGEPVPKTRDFVTGVMIVDEVLDNVPELRAHPAKWRTMVRLDDIDGVRRMYPGWLVVVHRNPMAEILREGLPDDPSSDRAAQVLIDGFGKPAYLDGQLAVWRVH